MILGAISLLDCVVFVICLIPQLLLQAGLTETLHTVAKVAPFLLFNLPIQLYHERYRLPKEKRSPFCQNATFFQDLVVRCVRYAFAKIPASIGRVFFSKEVAHPFFRFRLLRHGYWKSPIQYSEVKRRDFRGLWIAAEPDREPDVIMFYCHGGGFSMGSSYFYLEFLIAWITCLQDRGYNNPAIFALEYTLVPDAQWPKQFDETRAAFQFVKNSFSDGAGSRICVSGDSAGATLVLSMLLHPASLDEEAHFDKIDRPALAVLLSPWTHLVSELNKNTSSDYLDNQSLHSYAGQYAGKLTRTNAVVSPGLSSGRWNKASPLDGYRIVYGAEEVFAPGIEETIKQMKEDGVIVKQYSEDAGIHAWPVVKLFLGGSREERLSGLQKMTDYVVNSQLKPVSRSRL